MDLCGTIFENLYETFIVACGRNIFMALHQSNRPICPKLLELYDSRLSFYEEDLGEDTAMIQISHQEASKMVGMHAVDGVYAPIVCSSKL